MLGRGVDQDVEVHAKWNPDLDLLSEGLAKLSRRDLVRTGLLGIQEDTVKHPVNAIYRLLGLVVEVASRVVSQVEVLEQEGHKLLLSHELLFLVVAERIIFAFRVELFRLQAHLDKECLQKSSVGLML